MSDDTKRTRAQLCGLAKVFDGVPHVDDEVATDSIGGVMRYAAGNIERLEKERDELNAENERLSKDRDLFRLMLDSVAKERDEFRSSLARLSDTARIVEQGRGDLASIDDAAFRRKAALKVLVALDPLGEVRRIASTGSSKVNEMATVSVVFADALIEALRRK